MDQDPNFFPRSEMHPFLVLSSGLLSPSNTLAIGIAEQPWNESLILLFSAPFVLPSQERAPDPTAASSVAFTRQLSHLRR